MGLPNFFKKDMADVNAQAPVQEAQPVAGQPVSAAPQDVPQPSVEEAKPAEPEAPAEEKAEAPKEDRSAFNCPSCSGEGLKDQYTVCSQCNGTGKV